MSMQARPPIDDRRYGRILSRMCTRPIRNDGELEQAIARLGDLDRRDQDLTSEERELAELYTALIEAYEERHDPVPHAPPHEFLRSLLVERGLAQAGIAHPLHRQGPSQEAGRVFQLAGRAVH